MSLAIKKIISIASDIIDLAVAPAWVIFVVLLIAQVVARYVLKVPLMWAEEVARVALIWLTFIGATRVALVDDHIDIPIISSRTTGAARYILRALKAICILATSVLLTYGGWQLLEFSSNATSPAAGLSLAWWYWPAIIGGIGMLFSIVVVLFPSINPKE